jgi:hypothetical protein
MDLQTPAETVRHPLSGLQPDAGTPRAESERRPPPDFVDFKEPDYQDRPDIVDVVDRPDRPDVVDIVDVKDRTDYTDFVDVKDIVER